MTTAANILKSKHDPSVYSVPPETTVFEAVKLMAAPKWDKALLEDLCQVMADASICGLGQAAPNPIRLTMKHFGEEV